MKRHVILLFATFILFLAACGSQEPLVTPIAITPNPTSVTSTPDPCAGENLAEAIKKVNDLQREFDDASRLASNLAREQLPIPSPVCSAFAAPQKTIKPRLSGDTQSTSIGPHEYRDRHYDCLHGWRGYRVPSIQGSRMRVQSTIYTRSKFRGCLE